MKSLNNNSIIIKNTSALYIRMGITMIISFFTARVTLSVLGVDNYGLNNLIGGVASMFSFINLSMGTAVQRFYSIEIGKKDQGSLSKVFGTGMYLHIIISLITFILAEFFAFFYLEKLNIPEDRIFAAHFVFQIVTFSLILQILIVPFASFLRAREEFSRMALIEIIQAISKLLVLYLLVRINYDKLITLSILSFGITLYYIISIVFLAKKHIERISINPDKTLLKEMIHFSFMIIFSVFASLFSQKGIVILINLFFGLVVNAAYAIADQVSSIVNSFIMNFKQAVVPQLMSSYGAKNYDRMNKLIFSGTKLTFLLLMSVTFPIIFETQFILDLWLDEVPEYSAIFTSLILININIASFPYFLYQAIHATGNIKKLQIITSILYLLNFVFVYLFLKAGAGKYSVVYVTIACSIFNNIAIFIFAGKQLSFSFRIFLNEVLYKCTTMAFSLMVILLGIITVMDDSIIRFFLMFFFSIISTSFFGYYMIFNKSEQNLVNKYIMAIGGKLNKRN